MSWLDAPWPLLKPLLFQMDPEDAHHRVMASLPLLQRVLFPPAPEPRLATKVGPLSWGCPVGLAAGLDKDGVGIPLWAALGFGAVEVGTVTALPQPGNPRPRLFRIPSEKALINRMGFNNGGALALAVRLEKLRQDGWPAVPVGANIGRSKLAEDAVEDYRASAEMLAGKADYYVVNVSSPNTPGLRTLQEAGALQALLRVVVPRVGGPVFVKLAPDLSEEALGEAVEVAIGEGAGGIVACNTTLQRPGKTGENGEAGGLSGRPLQALSWPKIRVAVEAARGRVPVVGVGGVESAEDVRTLLGMGCAAVQLYTALIYEGPGLVRRIRDALLASQGESP